MRKLLRRSWLLATVLLAAVVGAAYLVVPVEESGINRANKIQVGWTRDQVAQVLGDVLVHSGPGDTVEWRNEDEDTIRVKFDEAGHVEKKSYTPSGLSAFELFKRRVERRICALWR